MRQAELAIRGEHLGEPRRQIGAIFQIAEHRAVECGRGRLGGRRNRQSMDVVVHLARPRVG